MPSGRDMVYKEFIKSQTAFVKVILIKHVLTIDDMLPTPFIQLK